MNLFVRLAFSAGLTFVALGGAHAAGPEDTLVIKTKGGEIDIALRPDLAPKHVEQIKALARAHAYDGVVFHRVIDGFMAQTGDVQYGKSGSSYDPSLVGTGGSDKPDIVAEFSKEHFARGTVGMARSSAPNSANSQFFIMFDEGGFLDGQYTIVGTVEAGMDVVDKIKRGDADAGGAVEGPDVMETVRVGSDKS